MDTTKMWLLVGEGESFKKDFIGLNYSIKPSPSSWPMSTHLVSIALYVIHSWMNQSFEARYRFRILQYRSFSKREHTFRTLLKHPFARTRRSSRVPKPHESRRRTETIDKFRFDSWSREGRWTSSRLAKPVSRFSRGYVWLSFLWTVEHAWVNKQPSHLHDCPSVTHCLPRQRYRAAPRRIKAYPTVTYRQIRRRGWEE